MPWGIDDDAARPDVDDSASPPIESEPHDEVDTSDEVTPVPLARVDASITGPAEADPVTDRVSDTGSPAVATSPEPPRSSRVGWLAACAAVVSIIAGGTAASMLTDDDGAAAVASAAGGLRAPAAPELVLPVAAPPERTAAPGAMRAPSTEAPLRPRDAATSSSELDPAATSTTAATADAPAPDADPPSTPRKRPAIPHVDVAIRVMWIDAGIDLKIGSKRAAVDADGTLRVAAGKHRVSWRERGMTAWTDAGVQDFSAGARHVLRIGKTGGAGGVAHDVRPEGGK